MSESGRDCSLFHVAVAAQTNKRPRHSQVVVILTEIEAKCY